MRTCEHECDCAEFRRSTINYCFPNENPCVKTESDWNKPLYVVCDASQINWTFQTDDEIGGKKSKIHIIFFIVVGWKSMENCECENTVMISSDDGVKIKQNQMKSKKTRK